MSATALPLSTITSVGWPSGSDLEYYDEEAQRISDLIDEGLKQEALRRKDARKKEVRVLLLGQAESGKSTLHKQFQLFYASQTLEQERPSWRAVVYLNILRAIRTIVQGLKHAISETLDGSPDSNSFVGSLKDEIRDELSHLEINLQPLLDMEDRLSSELNGGLSGRVSAYVRTGWQSLIYPRLSTREKLPETHEMKLVSEALRTTRPTIESLWCHPVVVGLVARRKLRLEDSAPFFLDNIHRITETEYIPTTDDILRVRMETLGVVEHSLSVRQGGLDYTWRMYDVSGARGHRHAWVPFFDDATAILFLAPISGFDQQLEEDSKINRLEDSLQLSTAICSNKLLQNASLIVLLNKIDLLKQKLQNGRKVRKYVPSYGNRPNTYESVSQYFRAHFSRVHSRHDEGHRGLFVHFTSMLDIQATHIVIRDVGESILRKHISEAGLA